MLFEQEEQQQQQESKWKIYQKKRYENEWELMLETAKTTLQISLCSQQQFQTPSAMLQKKKPSRNLHNSSMYVHTYVCMCVRVGIYKCYAEVA